MADEERKIKVTDLRMFTPEGDLRPEYRDLEEAREGESGGPAPAAAEASPAPEPAPEAGAEAGAPPAPPREGPADPEFADLVNSLATSALAAMGMLGEPGARASVDLAGARRMIEWLTMLERKTRRNLTFAEEDLLSRALYELRVSFVRLSTPPGARGGR